MHQIVVVTFVHDVAVPFSVLSGKVLRELVIFLIDLSSFGAKFHCFFVEFRLMVVGLSNGLDLTALCVGLDGLILF